MFGEWTFHIESLCEMMSNDAKLADILPSNRYIRNDMYLISKEVNNL